MPVELIKTKVEFDKCLKENAKVAVDFTASWCGPCRMIGPKFEAFANGGDYGSVKFIKVDVDDNSDTAEACGISAMPTFFFYHNGEKIDELVGASEQKLKTKVEELNKK